jgi:NADPH:quinone reductase-like Zn-dependent oxidoreductase
LNGKFSTVQPWTEKSVAKFTGGGRGFDIVYDTVGGATLNASFNAVHG